MNGTKNFDSKCRQNLKKPTGNRKLSESVAEIASLKKSTQKLNNCPQTNKQTGKCINFLQVIIYVFIIVIRLEGSISVSGRIYWTRISQIMKYVGQV